MSFALVACATPPPPAAEHAGAAPRRPSFATAHAEPTSGGAADDLEAARRCGLVTRAPRTWVGFAEGMSLDDMVPAARAAASVVRALDATLCDLVERGTLVPVLALHAPQLRAAAADGGAGRGRGRGRGYEATKVLWQDESFTRADVELQFRSASASAPAPAPAWRASVVRQGGAWCIDSFASGE